MAEKSEPILLIEDDTSLCESLGHFLGDHGYRTISASTAREGWALLSSVRPRLCLLDMNLPDGSGLDLLKRIVQEKLAVRVMVMTAFDLLHLRPAGASHVLAGWMTKPVNPSELLERVDAVMRGERESPEAGSASPARGGPAARK